MNSVVCLQSSKNERHGWTGTELTRSVFLAGFLVIMGVERTGNVDMVVESSS